jgi:hypothetical protein
VPDTFMNVISFLLTTIWWTGPQCSYFTGKETEAHQS